MILHLFQKRISISYERTYIRPEIFSPAIVMAYQVRVNQCTHFTCRRLTRMHSRRMRAARLLPVFSSMHCSTAPRGCTCLGSVYLSGEGTCLEGGYLPRYPPLVNRILNTLLKILPCPKLRLRAVKNKQKINLFRACSH